MKFKNLVTFIVCLVLLLPVIGCKEKEIYSEESLVEIKAKLKSENIYNVCDNFAQKYYKTERNKHGFEQLLTQVKNNLDNVHDVQKVIKQINHQLYDVLNYEAVNTATNPKYLLPSSVIKNHKGFCVSLSIIYISIAEELGFDFHAKILPEHLYIAYSDKENKFNIETTCKGDFILDAEYYNKLHPLARQTNIYLTSLSKEQLFAVFLNNLGACLITENRYKEALEVLCISQDMFPELPDTYSNIGNVYFKLNKIKKAQKYFLEAHSYDETRWPIESNIAKVYLNQNDYADAIIFYQRAIELLLKTGPLSEILRNMPQETEMETIVKNYISSNNQDIIKGKLLSFQCLRLNKNSLAIKLLQKLIESREDDLIINNLFIVACLREQQYDLLPNIVLSSKTKNPQDFEYGFASFPKMIAPLYKELGIALYYDKNYSNSIKNFKISTKLIGKDADTSFLIGDCYYKQGDMEYAQKFYEEALSLDSTHKDASKKLSYLKKHWQ